MEDFVTWVDTSKLKRHVQKYNVSRDELALLSSPSIKLTFLRCNRTSWTTSSSWHRVDRGGQELSVHCIVRFAILTVDRIASFRRGARTATRHV